MSKAQHVEMKERIKLLVSHLNMSDKFPSKSSYSITKSAATFAFDIYSWPIRLDTRPRPLLGLSITPEPSPSL